MKTKINLEKGVASLPTVIGLTILILAVGIGVTAISLNENFIAAGQRQSSDALLYAEAGVRDALIRIARNKNYVCASPSTGCYQINFVSNGCSDNEGCAKITVSSGAGSAADPKIINSEGRVKNNIRRIRASAVYDSSLNGEIQSVNWEEITE